ncbi:MAG TPA: vitamin K epoxide reductase family protein [Acidimicrobiales bacterium]|nr:vitamin K epoxide reductase family protein [Acidimicrobiales bacterium]
MIASPYRVPAWARWSSLGLSLIGLALSIYLTIAHYRGSQILACSDQGLVNCAVVTTSAQSRFLGMPVAVLGLANYLVMSALVTPWAWRAPWRFVHLARFALAAIAMVFVLWLVYAEIVVIGHLCMYCTGVHAVTFALLIVLTRVAPRQLGWAENSDSTQGAPL